MALAVVALAGCSGTEPDMDPERTQQQRQPPSRYGSPRVIGRLQDPDLTELSGIAASTHGPERFWAHNDSGGEPILFCLEPTGATCGTAVVEGAEVVDWEDIAIAPGPGGGALYIADIGDNERVRDSVTIYRGAEPRTDAATVVVEALVLTYPGRAHDAEALVVEPTTGDAYLITKEYARRARVFVARAPLGPATTLRPIATLDLAGPLAVVTGADVSRDGDRVVLSTYAAGFELVRPKGAPFDEIWEQRPVRFQLGPHAQNEAVTYARSGDIVSGSEGARSPLYSVEYLARP